MVWVIGMGHHAMSDDSAGLRAVRDLSARRWPEGVEFIEAAAPAPDVLPWAGPGHPVEPLHIVVADAVSTGMPAGAVVRVALDDPCAGLDGGSNLSLHTLGLDAMLAPLRIAGTHPNSVTLVGIEAASTAAGCAMSDHLQGSWDSYLRALADEILAHCDPRRALSRETPSA